METAIVPVNGSAIAHRWQPQPLVFTEDQRRIIRDSYANGATDEEFEVLIQASMARRFNPLLGHVHYVKRWDSNLRREKWAIQPSIDGMRAKANETGLYDGQDEPEFEYDANGEIKFARVRVYRKDVSRPFVGVAHFCEYAQKTKEGKLTRMWANMPHIMISKCAEALAFRKAFPEELAGVYTKEEMMQSEAGEEAAPRRKLSAKASAVAAEEASAPEEKTVDQQVAEWIERLDACSTSKEVAMVVGALVKCEYPTSVRDRIVPAWREAEARVTNGGSIE